MRIIAQRVAHASVSVNNQITGQIKQGLLLLVGIDQTDTTIQADTLAKKIANLRIFKDQNDKMNLSIQDINGEILSISQFTLYANCKKGNRPSFIEAAKPELANNLYNYFNNTLKKQYNIPTHTGIFGADMKVNLLNDGPVTIILDSNNL